MKGKAFTGYAVATEDLSAWSFKDYSLDTCIRYCRNGYVIVRTFKKKLGYAIRITIHKWYKPFSFRPRWNEFNILWIHVSWNAIYVDRLDDKIVFKPNKEL